MARSLAEQCDPMLERTQLTSGSPQTGTSVLSNSKTIRCLHRLRCNEARGGGMMVCFLPFLLRRKSQSTENEDTANGYATSTQEGTSVRWNRTSTTLMFAAALFTRLVASTLLYRLQMDPQRDYWGFGWETGRIAHSISVGKGFSAPVYGYEGPTAWMAPVYPYLLAGVFRFFGDFSRWSALAILSLNSIFSALTCLPVFHIARRVLGPRTAIWAGWAWAVYPFAIYFASVRVWETCLTTLLLSLALWFTL